MMNVIKRIFSRIFRSLISYYGPAALTIIFALVQGVLFPGGPVWLVPLFFVFLMVILSVYEIVSSRR